MSTLTLGGFAPSVLRTFQVVLSLGATVLLSCVTIRGRLRHGRRSAAKRTIASGFDPASGKMPGKCGREVPDPRPRAIRRDNN